MTQKQTCKVALLKLCGYDSGSIHWSKQPHSSLSVHITDPSAAPNQTCTSPFREADNTIEFAWGTIAMSAVGEVRCSFRPASHVPWPWSSLLPPPPPSLKTRTNQTWLARVWCKLSSARTADLDANLKHSFALWSIQILSPRSSTQPARSVVVKRVQWASYKQPHRNSSPRRLDGAL